MYPFFSLLAFILAIASVIVSLINAIRKNKNPSLKLRWILIPLIFAFISLIINRYISGEISEQNKKDMETLKEKLESTKSSLDSSIIEQDSLKEKNKGLKAQQDSINKELSLTKEKLADRTITKGQEEKFISFLKDKPKGRVSFLYLVNNDESVSFTKKLEKLLIKAGFEIEGASPGYLEYLNWMGEPHGIEILYNDKSLPKIASDLKESFELIGIPCPVVGASREMYAKTWAIFVGRK